VTSFAAVISRLEQLDNPYPGLRPFETEESHLFFGRDQQVADVVARLERNRFLAVLGVSGSGKSSLVRAGLIPALQRGSIAEPGRRWRVVITHPAGAPFDSLAAALTKAGLDAASVRDSSHGLIDLRRQLTADERLLVIVDQFEELFRYKDSAPISVSARRELAVMADSAAKFVQLLLAAARQYAPIYVVITMRSDYLGDCAEFRDLPETLNDCQYLLPRMTREERKKAIEGPLARVEMASNLVQRLLNDAGDEPDQLPVLQHALMRTWWHWRKADPDRVRRIELRDYEAIGGFDKALNQHASELLDGVPADLAATVFKRLSARGRGRRERRDPATLRELWAVCGADSPDRQSVVTAIVERYRRGEATFLSPRNGALNPETYIDITHESLIRQWQKLRDEWLPEEEKSAKSFLDLAERARKWSDGQAELLMGADLSAAVEWNARRNKTLAWACHYADPGELTRAVAFIQASERHQREELAKQARERRRLRLAEIVAAFAIVAVAIAVGFNQFRAARAARTSAAQARILSAPSVQDPLVRALLLNELRDYATADHLAIYQQAAAAAVPFAVRRHLPNLEAKSIGFLGDRRIGVVFADGTVSLWTDDGYDDPTVRQVAKLTARGLVADTSPWISAAAFSHDGQWVALGLCTGEVWLHGLDGPTRSPYIAREATCPAEANPATALSFSRNGRLLAAGHQDSTIRVWRLDGTEGLPRDALRTFTPPQNRATISSIDIDPTGTRVVTGSPDGCLIWDLDGSMPQSVTLGGNDAVTGAVFSPDGSWVLCGYASGVARLSASHEDGVTGQTNLQGHAAAVTSVAFSSEGTSIVTASADRTARVWTIRTGSKGGERVPLPSTVASARILTHGGIVTGAAFSHDGQTIVTTSDDATVRMWPAAQREPRTLGVHEGSVESVVFSSKGELVASASSDGTARVWRVEQASTPEPLEGHNDWVRSVAFNPANQRQLLTASDDGTLRIWDWESRESRVSAERKGVFTASFDPKGSRIVTAVKDNTARIWTLSSLEEGGWHKDNPRLNEMVELPHKDWVRSAAFSDDGSRIVTASKDGTVSVWALDQRAKEPKQFRDHQGALVFSAAFSHDGSRVVAGSADGVARVWRVDGSGEPLELRHLKDVRKVTYSSRGEWILTASMDGTARLWNPETGAERLALQHGDEPVLAAAFDPSDAHIVTGTREGVVRLWRVTLPALTEYVTTVSRACLTPGMRVQHLGESEEQARSAYERCERSYRRTPIASSR
jgi:WD40 repeat protein